MLECRILLILKLGNDFTKHKGRRIMGIKSLGKIRFSIAPNDNEIGDFPIDDFTKSMGITPTESYKVGEEYIRGNRVQKRIESAWILDSGYQNEERWYEFSDLFDLVIEPLRKNEDIINEYKKIYSLVAKIRIYFQFANAQTPGVHLDIKTIEFANNIGAEIEIFIDNLKDNVCKY